MRSTQPQPRPDARDTRRGITLIEMLVSVALLVLMMSVIVQVFVAATGAVSASRTFQELDGSLRQLDSTIRQDLSNVTARFTPPLNPKDNLGYFEYAENSFADNQGEDCDDTLRFTVKAPEGQYFTGRFWPNSTAYTNPTSLSAAQFQAYLRAHPITVQSRFAEVIYFLRNGNLYRRVLLVAPELQPAVVSAQPFLIPAAFGGDTLPAASHVPVVSWLGMNDLSARPNSQSQMFAGFDVRLNTLGDLTNRENRYASPRFVSDFRTYNPPPVDGFGPNPDGLPDDENRDTVPDFYPSLYYGALSPTRSGLPSNYPARLVNEFTPAPRPVLSGLSTVDALAKMPFPYVFPGAYSKPVIAQATAGMGWIHGPDPTNSQLTLELLNQINHNPIEIGDSLPLPVAVDPSNPATGQTWWGFPTWRETLGRFWSDPVHLVASSQPNGLRPRDPAVPIPTAAELTRVPFLPPMTLGLIGSTPYRVASQSNTDGAGAQTLALTQGPGLPADFLWSQSWEDDLIMTGVRSFDVKGYDDAYGGYVDLGWGNDLRQYVGYKPAQTMATAQAPLLGHQSSYLVQANGVSVINPLFFWPPASDATWPPTSGAASFDLINQTLAHEGRIPPRIVDNRPDYQYPAWNPNLGDDGTSVVRLRRVWDTWSTDYCYAPATGVYTDPADPINNGRSIGPPNSAPIYPSYPPPYPAPLRGIQIQIRLVDPRNEHLKVLTIRQDFSSRL